MVERWIALDVTRVWDLAALACCLLGALGCRSFDPPPDSHGTFAACCEGRGTCVPRGLVGAERALQLGQDSCGEALVCVPEQLLELDNPNAFAPTQCHDEATHAEGRCLPACLASVRAQVDRLRSGGCPSEQRCVPCFNPIDGTATGACTLTTADPGPSEPAVTFARCCESLGTCVPATLLPSGAPALPRLSCGTDEVCAPTQLVTSSDGQLTGCLSSDASPGACLPSCILLDLQWPSFGEGNCDSGNSCVPCQWQNTETGVCR